MRMTSKFGPLLFEQVQASGAPLIDQDHNVVRYEERMNRSQYGYIVDKQLYDADQQAIVGTTGGLLLPASSAPTNNDDGLDGAIEVKAAWRQLEGQPSSITDRFKTTKALLYDPASNGCSNPVTMGLVGLHVVRKTSNMQQLMWATFEQVDNVPLDLAAPDPSIKYSFYNPACQFPDPCAPNATPVPIAPKSMATPQPVQVVRTQTVPSDVRTLNQYVQQTIANANESSVWQYYQLINVRWPSRSQLSDPNEIIRVPVDLAPFMFQSSGNQPVNNVVLETYVQELDCTSCHRRAAIAPSAAATCTPTVASDFSFMFRNADTPTHYRANNC
jgi:hypothetical protein